jgi:rubredoxin
MSEYVQIECLICDYIYDPEKGEVPAGTPFEELPESGICPVCGADKSQFERVA